MNVTKIIRVLSVFAVLLSLVVFVGNTNYFHDLEVKFYINAYWWGLMILSMLNIATNAAVLLGIRSHTNFIKISTAFNLIIAVSTVLMLTDDLLPKGLTILTEVNVVVAVAVPLLYEFFYSREPIIVDHRNAKF